LTQYEHLAAEKQQTDVMLEKFSLVLDLDFDRKSTVELSLANNYESRGENEQAILLYNKIIARFDNLTDTDIAFNAGQRLISLLIKNNQLDLNNLSLLTLKNKLEFIPNTNLPISAAQAFFYHLQIDASYKRDNNNVDDVFNMHSQLIQGIKEHYWQELTNTQKQTIDFSNAIQMAEKPLTPLQNSFYFKQQTSLLSRYLNKLTTVVDGFFNAQNSDIVSEKKFKQFIERHPIFLAGTHENDVEHEGGNSVIFNQGIMKLKDFDAIYQIKDNKLTSDYGEGPEVDIALYVSDTLALTVPIQIGDLILLTYDDLLNDKKNLPWTKEELLSGPWYHLYDQALEQNAPIKPALMEANFTASSAALTIGGHSISVPWKINERDELELRLADNNQATLTMIKVAADENILITTNQTTGVQSLFIKDKKLAQHLLNQWASLL
jgi:hypothetical protein